MTVETNELCRIVREPLYKKSELHIKLPGDTEERLCANLAVFCYE